jgi:Icc protein
VTLTGKRAASAIISGAHAMRSYRTQGKALRLVQISDCHLSASAQKPYRGQNADAGLQSLLPAIADWGPDLVLATGDLSEDGSAASYRRLADYFHRLAAPVYALPGNHDVDATMRAYFPDGPWNGVLFGQAGDWGIVLLKSALAGRIDGVVGAADIDEVHKWIRARPGQPLILALHHQPVPVGSAWIDRYGLEAPGALLQLIEDRRQVRGVVWGHVHQAFESRLGQARLLACPSSAANSQPGSSKFVHDPAGPACRWLQLHDHGKIETGLLFGD